MEGSLIGAWEKANAPRRLAPQKQSIEAACTGADRASPRTARARAHACEPAAALLEDDERTEVVWGVPEYISACERRASGAQAPGQSGVGEQNAGGARVADAQPALEQ